MHSCSILHVKLEFGETPDTTRVMCHSTAQMGERALKLLKEHMVSFTYSSTGALRWKRDILEYAEALHPALQTAPVVRSHFEELKGEVNILVVAPESLVPLVDSSLRLPHAQALQYVSLREDFKTAKVKGQTLAMIFGS